MASKQSAEPDAFEPILAALAAMQSNASREQKTHAHEYLEKFQKSVRDCHTICGTLLTRVASLKHGMLPTLFCSLPLRQWRQNCSLRRLSRERYVKLIVVGFDPDHLPDFI